MKRERSIAFNARLPLDVDEWLEDQAAANCRSKNAEITFRLRGVMAADAAKQTAPQGEAPAARPSPQG